MAALTAARARMQHQTTQQQQTASRSAQPRLDELANPQNPDGIFSKDAAKQKDAMREFNKLARHSMSADEVLALNDTPTPELRERFGTNENVEQLPRFLQPKWDSETEGKYLRVLAGEGLGAERGLDGDSVWMACDCGARIVRRGGRGRRTCLQRLIGS